MDNSEKMFELADRLKALRDEKKDAEQRVKELNAALDETDAALAQLMTDTETQNFTRSGTMFCLTNTTRASATADHIVKRYIEQVGAADKVSVQRDGLTYSYAEVAVKSD